MRANRNHIHPSWLIGLFATACIIGIACSPVLLTQLPVPLLLISLSFAVIGLATRSRLAMSLVVIAGLSIGLWRGSAEQAALAQYHSLLGKSITLQGIVSDDTSFGPHGDQRVMLKDIHAASRALPGQIWISSTSAASIKRSDSVTVQGKLGSGFGGIAASMFNASVTQIIHPEPGDVGLRVRDWFADGIRAAIPEPEASLASGYLVGQRSTLPEDLDTQLRTVGLTHAVVASGYNLTILVSFARQLLAGVSKYLATLAGAGMIFGFMMISGLSPSMARAGLVTSLSLGAWYYGRRTHPFVLLPFAAAVTALINPAYVWGDIGWYLSFTSFAGVIIIAPLVQHYLWGTKRVGLIRQTLLDTMSAQLATLPIMIFAFGHYSPYALIANLLVLPLIPITMVLTFGAGVAGLAVPVAAHLFGLPATLILHYMTTVVARIAALPGAQGELSINIAVLFAGYATIAAIAVLLWRATRYDFHGDNSDELPNLTAT